MISVCGQEIYGSFSGTRLLLLPRPTSPVGPTRVFACVINISAAFRQRQHLGLYRHCLGRGNGSVVVRRWFGVCILTNFAHPMFGRPL